MSLSGGIDRRAATHRSRMAARGYSHRGETATSDRSCAADIPNRPKQPQRPISTVGSRWHSAALPPTELFIENGLGWFTGSRDSDCFRLACRLWRQYGDEAVVVGVIFKAWERSPAKDHPFSWQDAYHKIKQAERYWLEDREQILRRAESLMRASDDQLRR